jgi:hypothetical protein
MHHKRKRPKNSRAGCLMCKYWKINHMGKEKMYAGGNWKRRIAARTDLTTYKNDTE